MATELSDENVETTTITNEDKGYVDIPDSPASLCTVQNARSMAECVECRKPRVIYLYRQMTERQQYSLDLGLRDWEYSCGSPLLPPSNPVYKSVMCRSSLSCESPVEIAYIRAGLGPLNICCYCCSESKGQVEQELHKTVKTVLPICQECLDCGKEIITQRPYGNANRQRSEINTAVKQLYCSLLCSCISDIQFEKQNIR